MINFFEKALSENRNLLFEHEVYEILKQEGLNIPQYVLIKKNENFSLDKIPSGKVVLKIVSPTITHKSDVGGVKVSTKENAKSIVDGFFQKFNDIIGVLAIEFIEHNGDALGSELMIGMRNTDSFGYVTSIGPGGTDAEHLPKIFKEGKAHRIISPTITKTKEEYNKLIHESAAIDYLEGNVRGKKKLSSVDECSNWLIGFSKIIDKVSKSKFEIEELEVNPVAPKDGKLFALDGLLRFKLKEKEYKRPGIQDKKKRHEKMLKLINPKSVALIGVSDKAINPGRAILQNLVAEGFDKKNIFIVKPGLIEIDGCKCVENIKSLPTQVDVFVLSVAAEQVPEILTELHNNNKTHSVILISGGMAEKEGGELIENKVCEILSSSNIVLNGGNCLGVRSLESKFNTFFVPSSKLPSPKSGRENTAIISQSGAFAIVRMNRFSWLNPRYNITTGNQTDLTVGDYLDVLSYNEKIKVFGVYSEGFKPNDGLVFAESIKRIKDSGRDVVIYKAGRTEAGRSAVQGHTASIAGDYPTTKQILEASGAYVAENFEDFEDMLMLSSYFEGKKISGKNVFAISNAGFECAGLADHLELDLTKISSELKQKLDTILVKHKLSGIIGVKNPFDLTPMAGDQAIYEIVNELNDSNEIDYVVLSLVPFTKTMQSLPASANAGEDMLSQEGLIAKLKSLKINKPVLMCVDAGIMYDPYVTALQEAGMPVFRTIDRASHALSKYVDYKKGKNK